MFNLFTDYITWHYTQAIVSIVRTAKEFVRFFLNLFSVWLFFKTLFLPIFSIPVDDLGSSDIPDMIAGFFGGIIIRLIGALFRLLLIFLGIFLSLLAVLFFAVLLIFWIIMPAIFLPLLYFLFVFSFKII